MSDSASSAVRVAGGAPLSSLDPPRLEGSRCPSCATTVLGRTTSCPRCNGTDLRSLTLPSRGQVWAWTVQHFAPKPPYEPPEQGFAPFALGYVDLGDVLVESVLDVPAADLRIGLDVELRARQRRDDEWTFVFAAADSWPDGTGPSS
jgi:uncharacterized protein